MVKLDTARQRFLRAVQNFPRWMAIRKRPEKSLTGHFILSVIEEQEYIAEELRQFISEFFLISYVDRESETVDYVYIAQVGNFEDLAEVILEIPSLTITTDAKVFLKNINDYCLYQDGYFLISTDNVPSSESVTYKISGFRYGAKLERFHIWNIFDEFAMFLGLERYTNKDETNAQLLRRCFLTFSRPTNSTKTGLINVIRNCMDNDIKIEDDEIFIEVPGNDNVWNTDQDYGTIYEKLAWLNKDVIRTKTWGEGQWQHNFKTLDYLSHQWDKALEAYQDGVGQRGDLSVRMAGSEAETTDLEIQGYKYDPYTINEHCRRQRIQKRIPLTLTKYNNIVNGIDVQYKITATPVQQIDINSIFLREESKISGIQSYNLQDLLIDTSSGTIPAHAQLKKGKTYTLTFRSRDTYDDMAIEKANLVTPYETLNLLTPNRAFVYDGDFLRYIGTKAHVTRVSEAKSYTNITDIYSGMKISDGAYEGQLTIDVKGMGGQPLKTTIESEMYDITAQTNAWTLNGLEIENGKLLSATSTADNGSATLITGCMGFTLELEESCSGTASLDVYVDGVKNETLSRDVMVPGEVITENFTTRSTLKLEIKKSGEYPFSIKNIKTTNYEVFYNLTTGALTKEGDHYTLPQISDNIQNTLTVRIRNYDLESPIIRSIHIGSVTARQSYSIKNIQVTENNCYLDIRTNCQTYLYETKVSTSNGRMKTTNTLIDSDLSTAWSFKNDTGATMYMEIDLSKFAEVYSSTLAINKTVSNGEVIGYITFPPESDTSYTEIIITGIIKRNKARRSLKTLLGIEDTIRDQVYVTQEVPGFIIKNTTTGISKIATIDRNTLTKSDTFYYEGLPDTCQGVFYHDRTKNDIEYNNSTDRNFEDTYLTIISDNKSIAYNKITVFTSICDNEPIVNTWYPTLTKNALYFYRISDIVSNVDSTVVFKKDNAKYCLTPDQRKALEELKDLLLEPERNEVAIGTKVTSIRTKNNIILNNNSSLYSNVTDLLIQGSWSLGYNNLYITVDFDFNNTENYDLTIDGSDPVFTLSNRIELSEQITINNHNYDLGEFIIDVPDYLRVAYDDGDEWIMEPSTEVNTTTTLYVTSDGFYKLYYSNVINNDHFRIEIQNSSTGVWSEYNTSNCTLLEKEGLIIWNDIDNVVGAAFRVGYDHKKPIALEFKRLEDLYEIINYNIAAYKAIGDPVTYKNKTHGDNILVSFVDNNAIVDPDYVRLTCSNPNFTASYSNGTVYIVKSYTDDVALVSTGYYYDGPREFYYYDNLFTEEVEWYKGVTFHNIKKLDTIFLFNIASSNYVLHSDFAESKNWWEISHIGFADKEVAAAGISAFNSVTACESYNDWHTVNMRMSFTEGINGLAILFTEEDKNGYAIINITDHMNPGNLLSLFATNELITEIYREIKLPHTIQKNGEWVTFEDSLDKTFFCEPFAVFTEKDNFRGFTVSEDIDLSYQYYLVVRGSGVIDDIVSRYGVAIEDQINLHVKVIDDFAFDIAEKNATGSIFYLDFDKDHCEVDDLEIAKDGTIGVASNVDYGFTKIYDSNLDYDNITASTTVTRQKEAFVTTDSSGAVTTPKVFVDNYNSTVEIVVKVNDLIVDSMKNFSIKLYGSNRSDNDMTLISQKSKVNLASFVSEDAYSWLQVSVDMDPGKTITSIEIFVRYSEKTDVALSIIDYSHGSLFTKVYDLVTPADYRLKDIIYEEEIETEPEKVEEDDEEKESISDDISMDLEFKEEVQEVQKEDGAVSFQMRGCKKDNRDIVWTNWYDIIPNDTNNHIFLSYQFFQFRVYIKNPKHKIKISKFVMEVM